MATKKTEKTPKKTKAEMRVAIARDVLKLLPQRITAMPGTYLYSPTEITQEDVDNDTQLGSLMKMSCEVCALGAMFIAEVDINDKIGCRDLVANDLIRVGRSFYFGRHTLVERLAPFFSEKSLYSIEHSFESVYGFWPNAYPKARERLAAIMSNIIRNEGDFKPRNEVAFFRAQPAKPRQSAAT